MKKSVSILAVCIVMLSLLIPVCVPNAKAESFVYTQHMVTIDMNLVDNLFVARYGVTVYLDNVKLGRMCQGGRLLKIRDVRPGVHTVRVVADKKSVPDMSFDFSINTNLTLNVTLQTHRKYIDVNSMVVNLPNKRLTFCESNGDSWASFAEVLLWMAMGGI